MDIEHNPIVDQPTTTSTEPNPSINPDVYTATEISPGFKPQDNINGLLEVGTDTGNEPNNTTVSNSEYPSMEQHDITQETINENKKPDEVKEIAYDDTEEIEAQAIKVKKDAIELARRKFPNASEESVEQFGQKVAERVKTDAKKSKNAEKEEADNKGLKELTESLDSQDDKPLPEILPELFYNNNPGTPNEDLPYIDAANLGGTPSPVNEDGEWAAKQL